jgi:hypothetical protein
MPPMRTRDRAGGGTSSPPPGRARRMHGSATCRRRTRPMETFGRLARRLTLTAAVCAALPASEAVAAASPTTAHALALPSAAITSTSPARADANWRRRSPVADDSGKPVARRSTRDGNTRIQLMVFGARGAFPRVVWHWYGPGLKFSLTQTGRIRNRGAVLAVLGGICAVAGPETLGIACGVGAAEAGGIAAVASNAYGDRRCLELLWGAVPREAGC